MSAYLITVDGCDDETKLVMHLTAAEFSTVSQVAAAITEASRAGCQPRMSIREATASDLEDDDL